MAIMSPPILVAAATPINFVLRRRLVAVNIQVRFYTDADGLVEVGTRGTGSRDITATNISSAFEGVFGNPTRVVPNIVSDLENGTVTAMVDGKWIELLLGGAGLGQLTIAAATNTNPAGATSYRIIVDAEGSCSV